MSDRNRFIDVYLGSAGLLNWTGLDQTKYVLNGRSHLPVQWLCTLIKILIALLK